MENNKVDFYKEIMIISDKYLSSVSLYVVIAEYYDCGELVDADALKAFHSIQKAVNYIKDMITLGNKGYTSIKYYIRRVELD